jgi:F0F1-type ATP synthase assembly protein I
MSQAGKPVNNNKQKIINLALAVVAGQVGCATLVIVLAAVFIGLWLDSRFATRPVWTIVSVLVSIPISVLVMVLLARAAVSHIKAEPEKPKIPSQEDIDIGNHTS